MIPLNQSCKRLSNSIASLTNQCSTLQNLSNLCLFTLCFHETIKPLKMKNLICYFPITLILLLNLSCGNAPQPPQEQQPAFLFQKNTNDWIEQGNAEWIFANNEITGTSEKDSAGFIITNNPFADFMLTLEFNPDSTINSGVFIRCQNEDMNPKTCYEINIWDLHPNQDFRTGAIVTRFKPMAKVETLRQWNVYKIKCEKNRVQVWINDVMTADYENDDLQKGLIGLQAAGGGGG